MKRPRLPARLRRFAANQSGLALLEFAFALPVVLVLGCYGVETANLAITNLRVSQLTANLADNGSRLGLMSSTSSVVQMRELDLNNALQAARLQGTGLKIGTYGRVTLSSLEYVQQSYDSQPVMRIHWQRCFGMKSGTGYDSSYGTTTATAGTDATQSNAGTAAPSGMGDPGAMVTAPSGSGLIFVEVNYDYQRLFGSTFMGPAKLHYVASFIVRDRRDFAQLYNPSPTATRSTCDKYTS